VTSDAPPPERLTQLAFRIPPELIARLDRAVRRMARRTPDLPITRSDVFRAALRRGLDALEHDDAAARTTARRARGR
jgi:hypothetical protein